MSFCTYYISSPSAYLFPSIHSLSLLVKRIVLPVKEPWIFRWIKSNQIWMPSGMIRGGWRFWLRVRTTHAGLWGGRGDLALEFSFPFFIEQTLRLFSREILGRVILRELFHAILSKSLPARKTLYWQSLQLRDGLSASYATWMYILCSIYLLLSSSSNFETRNYPWDYCTKSSGYSLSPSRAQKSFVRRYLARKSEF